MNKVFGRALIGVLVVIVMPIAGQAQTISGWAEDIKSLHSVLEQLYDEMIPLCDQLIGVGRGIAAFAALWFIAARVWGHIARSESVDVYPLFSPFIKGFAILVFPSVIALINGVLQPTVTGTSRMVENSDAAIAVLLKEKENKVKESDHYLMYVGTDGSGNYDKWYRYTHDNEDPSEEGWMDAIGNNIKFAMSKAYYNFRNSVKEVIAEILQLLFAAASLAINTMRTFNLIILAVLGPLAFGLSVFDGFGHTLKQWIARYINIFMWLPVANLFGAVIGKIQENMLKIDINQVVETGDTFFSRTDMGYMIFLIIGILGYFSVPSIANQIVYVGGGNSLTGRATAAAMGGAAMGAGAAASIAGTAGQGALNTARAPYDLYQGYQQGGGSDGSSMASRAGTAYGQAGNYLKDKLSGNSGQS